jgi:CRISPR-associated endonuclease Cas3-HD
VSQTPLPPDDSVPLPAITSVELTTLAMTSPVLAADPEVDFYIADPIECDQVQVQIAARRYLDDHDLPVDIVRATLLRAPPRSHELASVSLPVPIPLPILKRSWVLSYDGGVLTADEWTKQIADPLRDGDVLVIPGDSPVLTKGIVDLRPGESMRDVMESVEDGEPDRVIRLSGPDAESLEALVARDPVLGTRSSRREVAQLLDGAGLSDVAKRLRVHRYLSELSVTWCGSNESQAGLLVVIETGRDGQEARRTVGEKPVKLDAHNRDVADRTAEIIRSLDGAVAQERDDLLLAARLHDIGKCHPEFQRRMGASPDGPALAKPAPGHVPDQGKGWRHEQLSTAWARAEGAGLLTQAVVAAHHGAGRPMFDDDDEAARLRWDGCPHDVVTALAELFGPYGAFEREREVLQRKLGVHRMAFLEALLRCADMQISSEVNE